MIELWISGTIDECAAAVHTGIAGTVATNPTLIRKWTASGATLEAVVREMVSKVDVPVYVQLHGPTTAGYLAEFDALRAISQQIHPKLVASHDGIAAAAVLARRRDVRPLVTAVTTLNQAYLAALAGAAHVAPYVARIQDGGEDPYRLIEDIADLYAQHEIETHIIAASVRSPQQSEAALNAGANAVVVFYDVFRALFDSRLTQQSIDGFEQDWATYRYEFDGPAEPVAAK